MTQIVIFVIGAGVGGISVWLAMKKPKVESGAVSESPKKNNLAEVMEERTKEKEEKKKRILEFFASRDKVSNDEIQTLLGVSDATATRYLDELEKEGKVRQVGKTGQSVFYEKI